MRHLTLLALLGLVSQYSASAEQTVLSQASLSSRQLQFAAINSVAPADFDAQGSIPALGQSGFSLAYKRPFPLPLIAPAKLYDLSDSRLRTRPTKVWRHSGSRQDFHAARLASMRDKRGLPQPQDYRPLQWQEVEVEGPDVGDMQTLSALAKMASNAYLPTDQASKGNKEWYDLGGKWNISDSFGWTEDGIRGHVFATPTNDTIVIALKGTSAGALIGGGGSTQINDKVNDNLLFSCCCARVDWSWSTVCDCYSGGWKCDENCVEDALVEKSVYYPLATDLYYNITAEYPNSNIWLVGHSLGGSLAGLLSLTFGVPCVTFEAVADKLAAQRLHLPMPPGRAPDSPFGSITHVYHNADPIPQGACTGSLSTCSLAGFALESRCHTGETIVFDTVSELGWSVDIRTHGIVNIIEKVLTEDWDVRSLERSPSFLSAFGNWGRKRRRPEPGKAENRTESNVPLPIVETGCLDCFKWEYGDYKGKQ